ncbi:hypothetical protein ASE85_02325 [Sphingobium sp. Leaf26]|uniref:hypothetical protein n=1 Tax=Sphingobium sp. Leaf26 TaxID=1735693 RepID=UPI0006FCFB15|nr:hypothetical protein [Sphingobium sp. Leaf26]KQN09796.1 hypothetical protein ASE85_02325 [Sphingobium sp. Leaf26]
MPDIAQTIAAIIDAPAWGERNAMHLVGRKVLRDSARMRKQDKHRRAASMKKAARILEAMAGHFTEAAQMALTFEEPADV